MKNNLIKFLTIGICLFTVYFILANNKLINNYIIYSVNLWITKVFPALFPMFIINEILICIGFPFLITKLFSKVTQKLKINAYAIYVFFMSIFSGTPTNAIILKSLVSKNELSSKDASYILSFTYFSNPLFLWTMLSTTFNSNITIKIILIHYLTNIIIFMFFKNKLSNYTSTIENKILFNIKLSDIISKSIKKSLDTLTMILGTITFYIIISTILLNCFSFNIFGETIVKGLLELTQGLNNLAYINTASKLKEIIAIAIISFGGLSIHSQIQNIISQTDIKYKYFLLGRLLHVLISIILVIIF